MQIDFHTHIRMDTLVSDRYWKGWIGIAKALSGAPEERIKERVQTILHIGADELIKDMDEAGIDKAVVIGVDWGLCKDIGEYHYTFEQYHEPIIQAIKKYPNRLFAEVGIDPRRKNAVELVERGIKEWGMKGVKLHPSLGIYPNDPACYPVWQKATDLGAIIHIHTGTEPFPFRIKYCQPIYVDDVACDFPDTPIVMAHCGMWEWEQAMTVAGQKPNVYVDLTAWQQAALTNPVEFFRILRNMCDWISYKKIMIGSDWPALRMMMSEKAWFDIFRNIPPKVKEAGIEFRQKEIDAILGGNAAKLLGLGA